MDEPVVILAKGKSGSTLLCEALNRGGLFLGTNCNRTWDNLDVMGLSGWLSWQYRKNVQMVNLKGLDDTDSDFIRKIFNFMLHVSDYHYLLPSTVHQDFFGWKVDYAILSAVFLPMKFDSVKFIHLIRDGRDCCLSYEKRNPRKDSVYFIKENPPSNLPRSFKPNTRDNALYNAYGWVNINSYILQLKKIKYGKWLTVTYEDLVTQPTQTIYEIMGFLPELNASFATYIKNNVHTDRIRKWKQNPHLIKSEPLKVMTPMLKEFGYI